jgi:alkanesulfonate monooxygenase SsuD/methylene tetrahydromethanopterin reductase-like flavin-dependent oxidoreductase (luciferase family)
MSTTDPAAPVRLALSLDTANLPSDAAPLTALLALAEAAEAGDVAALILRDSLVTDVGHGRRGLDASLAAAALAPLTHTVGLVPEIASAVAEPFHTATSTQTLDHASLGRAGLALRTPTPAELVASGERWAASGLDASADSLAADAADTLAAIARLWESWEPEAIIRDKDSGRFLDRERIHNPGFSGASFALEGASITPRSPQGRPPVLVTLHDRSLAALAGQRADVAVLAPATASLPDDAWAAGARALADAVLAEAAAERSAWATAPAPQLWLSVPSAFGPTGAREALKLAAAAGLAVDGLLIELGEHDTTAASVASLLAALGGEVTPPGPAPSGGARLTTLRAALGLTPALNPFAAARQHRLEEAS